jgi:hypothetical protein
MKKKLTPVEMTALAGYMILNDVDAAYRCVNDSESDGEIFHRMALRWVRRDLSVQFMKEQQTLMESKARKDLEDNIARQKDGSTSDDNDLTDKANVIRELQVLYKAEQNPKQKSEILMKIADLERMKNESTKEQEKLVHFYIPLRECKHCPHYSELTSQIE